MWLKQFQLILWKNFIIRKRHWFLTICEGLLPILLFFLVAYGRSKINNFSKKSVEEPVYPYERSGDQLVTSYFNAGDTNLLYVPENPFTSELMSKIQEKFQLTSEKIIGFDSEDEIFKHYARHPNGTIMALIFKTANNESLDYILRVHENYISWDTGKLFNPSFTYESDSGSSMYIYKGVLSLQYALESSYVEKISNKPLPFIQFQEFPYPPHSKDTFIADMFMYLLPLLTLFSFIFLCPAVLKRVVEEKNSGIKELLKMVGMKNWMLWLGWYLHAEVANFLSIIVIVFLMKVSLWGAPYPPIEYCNWSILLVFLFLYCTAAVGFCFLISSFFSRPSVAMVFGVLMWILTYFIPVAVIENYDKLSYCYKVLFAFLPNMALHYGYLEISVYEMREIGSGWSNLFVTGSGTNNDLSLGNVFVILILQTVLFMVLTFYIECINPGPYGIRKKPYFPITALIRFIQKMFQTSVNDFETVETGLVCIEEGKGLASSIEVKKLYKKYGHNMAVNDLNLDIYKNQITALLGHNGAGKTTTMSIITGMTEATSGSVRINGQDINQNIDKVREKLGLCPQHNLLFPDLTVFEHLVFFARLKGKAKKAAEEEATALLHRLGIINKRNELACKLSGGMKRKLCLGMAVIGDTEVLILDEPTSGMDPESRREVWNLLLEWRGSKTILITTHFMEEADVLGDWIAIMSNGTCICYGTPMFLKRKYNTGYQLSLMLDSNINLTTKDLISNDIKKKIDNAELKYENGNNLVFVLPTNEKRKFPQLLESLEKFRTDDSDKCPISNMAMSITTLEEVFLRTSGEASETVGAKDISTPDCILPFRVFKPLMLKHWLFLKRKWKNQMFPIIITASIMLLVAYLGEKSSDYYGKAEPGLKFNLGVYGETTVFYEASNKPLYTEMAEYYKKIVTEQGGIATEVPSVPDAIIKKGSENIAYYKHHMVVAAEFNADVVNVMYSNAALHGAPISLNLVMNSIVKSLVGKENSIKGTFIPLPAINSAASPQELSEIEIGLLWLFLVPIGILFLMGTFIIFPNKEHSTKFSQLQFISGVKVWMYWLSNFLFDFLIVYIPSIVSVTLFLFVSSIFSGTEYGTFLVILLCYGISGIPFSYLFSFKKSVSSGFALLLMFGMFAGIVPTIAILAMRESQDEYYINLAKSLKHLFMLFIPQFGLTYTTLNFITKAVQNYNWSVMPKEKKKLLCQSSLNINPCCQENSEGCKQFQNYFTNEEYAIMPDILEMLIPFIIYFSLVILLDSLVWKRMLNYYDQFYTKVKSIIQKDKTQDKPRNHSGSDTSSLNSNASSKFYVENLKKYFSGKLIVNNVTFEAEAGKCFGLLGVNGAGKTTTFRMLTYDIPSDEGRVRIKDGSKFIDITQDEEYFKKIGYCPQFDALNFDLSAKEILKIMAMLRNFSEEESEKVAEDFLDLLDLRKYGDKQCGTFSGGNKRKLSLAIALIGCRKFVLLDEPTSGVDPASRRKIWDIIKALRKKNVSFILTSHSMDECEALCENMAIMKEGEINDSGTIPSLKLRHSTGFNLKLKLKPNTTKNKDLTVRDVDEIDGPQRPKSSFLRKSSRSRGSASGQILAYPGCNNYRLDELKKRISDLYSPEIKDQHEGLLHYHIKGDKKLSELFASVEELKSHFEDVIDDYTISGTSLEDVFLSVARKP